MASWLCESGKCLPIKLASLCACSKWLHFYLLAGNVNHLFLVINSSVNFLIYCCMAKRFRDALVEMVVKMKHRICPSTPEDGTTGEATHVGYKPGGVTTAVWILWGEKYFDAFNECRICWKDTGQQFAVIAEGWLMLILEDEILLNCDVIHSPAVILSVIV